MSTPPELEFESELDEEFDDCEFPLEGVVDLPVDVGLELPFDVGGGALVGGWLVVGGTDVGVLCDVEFGAV